MDIKCSDPWKAALGQAEFERSRLMKSRQGTGRTWNRTQLWSPLEVQSDRIRDRHVVSVQAARPGSPPPGQSQRAKHVLGAGTKKSSKCLRAGQLERLEQLKRLEQAPLVERLEPLEHLHISEPTR